MRILLSTSEQNTVRTYKGSHPADGKPVSMRYGWILYERGCAPGTRWLMVKLVSREPRVKANFSLAWHLDEKRMSGGKEARTLQRYQPVVYEWLKQELMQCFAHDPLAHKGGQ